MSQCTRDLQFGRIPENGKWSYRSLRVRLTATEEGCTRRPGEKDGLSPSRFGLSATTFFIWHDAALSLERADAHRVRSSRFLMVTAKIRLEGEHPTLPAVMP